MQHSLIKYYNINSVLSISFSSNLPLNFYTEGYYLLWSYDKLPNFIEKNSFFWVKEEEKRAFEYEYWDKISFVMDLKTKNELVKEKMKEDTRAFVFFLFYLDFYLKNSFKFNIFIPLTYIKLYEFYSLFFSKNTEYLNYFIKQATVILKKYEFVNSLLLKKIDFLSFGKSYSSFLFYYNSTLISPLFEYYYLFPLYENFFLEKNENLIESKNFFFKFIDFFKNWFFFIKMGITRFFSFLNTRFFFFDINDFLINFFFVKKSLDFFLLKKVEDLIYQEQMSYIYNLDPYINMDMLDEQEDFFLLNYIEEDFFSLDDSLILEDSLKYTADYFFSLLSENHIKKYKIFQNDLIIDYYFINYNEILLNFFFKLYIKGNGFFFFNYNYSSINFLKNLYSNYIFFKKLIEVSPFVYNSDTQEKYKFLNEMTSEIYIKNLYFNSSSIKTFFLEKKISLRNIGNLKKFNSYFFFLEKYMYFNYYVSGSLRVENSSFFKLIKYQNSFSIENEFSGNFFIKSFIFPNYTNFENMKNYFIDFYLNVQKVNNNLILLGNNNFLDKNSFDFFFFNSKSSTGFLKYSTDFFLKFYDLPVDEFESLYSMKTEDTHYNAVNLVLCSYSYIKIITEILKIK
jgi:hypothetical protein